MTPVNSGDKGGDSHPSTESRMSFLPVVSKYALTLIIGVLIAYFYNKHCTEYINVSTPNLAKPPLQGAGHRLLGIRGELLFKSLDDDSDGKISRNEFGTIVEKLTGEVSG